MKGLITVYLTNIWDRLWDIMDEHASFKLTKLNHQPSMEMSQVPHIKGGGVLVIRHIETH